MISNGLSNCPECGTPLTAPGPAPQRCGECGFDYAADTVVYRPQRPWRLYALFALALALLPGLLSFLDTTITQFRRPSPLQVLLAAASVALIIYCAMRLRVLLEFNRYAAITPSGVRARTPRLPIFVAWHELQSVARNGARLRLTRFGQQPPVWLEWVFDDPADAAAFCDALHTAGLRHAGQAIPCLDEIEPAGDG